MKCYSRCVTRLVYSNTTENYYRVYCWFNKTLGHTGMMEIKYKIVFNEIYKISEDGEYLIFICGE